MASVFDHEINLKQIDYIKWEDLRDKSIFITGATGLVGFALIRFLLSVNDVYGLNIKISALVRSRERAEKRFSEDISKINLIVGSVEDMPEISIPVDYIVHGASKTASREFVDHAVETLETAFIGTNNVLKLAAEKKVSSFIYLSSMEIYGCPIKGHKVTEDEVGTFLPQIIRNSYPIGKLCCESLCHAYYVEYKLPTKIVRLTQTFGADVNYDDSRIFAYFAKCAAEKKDIVLKTKGEMERSYLYVYDAVTAIICIILYGECDHTYNVADEDTYCSIYEVAKAVAEDARIDVHFDIKAEKEDAYPDALYMDIDTTHLRNLGWNVSGKGREFSRALKFVDY